MTFYFSYALITNWYNLRVVILILIFVGHNTHTHTIMPDVGASADAPADYRVTTRLPDFSGEAKHTSFEIYKYEIMCLIQEGVKETNIRAAIRRSVRGQAQKTLLILGTDAKVSDILKKFETTFGPTLSAQTVLANLYTMKQREGEDAGSFGARLEDTVQQAITLGRASRTEADKMLREAFQGGLARHTKMATAYLLADSNVAFDRLVLEVKRVEQELNLVGAGQLNAIARPDGEVEKLREMVAQLQRKVVELEKRQADGPGSALQSGLAGGQNHYSYGRGHQPQDGSFRGRGNQNAPNSFSRGWGFQPSRGRASMSQGQGSREQGRHSKVCYTCGVPGHFSRECARGGHLNEQQPGGRGHSQA